MLGVDAHFNFILFLFLKHGDKFLCFQKNPDTVWTGPKTKKKKTQKRLLCVNGRQKRRKKILYPDTRG